MEWFIALIVGGLIGWLIYSVYPTDKEETSLTHIVAGILGGLAGKWILSSVWVVGSYMVGNDFNLYSVLWAIVGGALFAGIWRALTYSAKGTGRITA